MTEISDLIYTTKPKKTTNMVTISKVQYDALEAQVEELTTELGEVNHGFEIQQKPLLHTRIGYPICPPV